MASRFPARTTSDPSIVSWGKPATSGGAPAYGVASGGTSSSMTVGTTTYTRLTFSSDGTLTVSKAGSFDVLLIGGGGGGATASYADAGSGGAGGWLQSSIYLPVGSYSIQVGPGGGTSRNGRSSGIINYISIAGGGHGGHGTFESPSLGQGSDGSSGGGAGNSYSAGYGSAGSGTSGMGFNGSTGGGGGQGAAGSGGTGGAAKDHSSWFGQSAGTTYYGAGGGGSPTGAGTAGSGTGYAGIVHVRFA